MVDDANPTHERVFANRNAEEAASQGAATGAGDSGRGRQVVEQVLNFVQEQPWLALAGAFVLGYVAAQIVKRMD